MKLPRDFSGDHLAQALCREFRYLRVHQVGSHIILQTETPSHHRIPHRHTPNCGLER